MRDREEGFTIWFTGLHGAGKSTLARLLEERLLERGYRVVRLEPGRGSELRSRLMPDLGFDAAARHEAVRRASFAAQLVTQAGGIALVPWAAPELSVRNELRQEIDRFVEVYVECPMEVCMDRDDAGVYARAQRGEFTAPGIGEPWEPPVDPEVTVHSNRDTLEQEATTILERLENLGYLGN